MVRLNRYVLSYLSSLKTKGSVLVQYKLNKITVGKDSKTGTVDRCF